MLTTIYDYVSFTLSEHLPIFDTNVARLGELSVEKNPGEVAIFVSIRITFALGLGSHINIKDQLRTQIDYDS